MTTTATKAAAAFLFHTDVYKFGTFHSDVLPEGTTEVFSNYTNRGSRLEGVGKVVNFGLTGFLHDLYSEYEKFLGGDLQEILDYYSGVHRNVLGFEADTTHIVELWNYGVATDGGFPVQFYSLPEGAEVPIKVPSFVFRNTDPAFAWLTNYIETWLSASIWYPSTIATKSVRLRRMLNRYAIRSTGSTTGVEFQGHDFAYRGLASRGAAALEGVSHLLAFDGSDNLEAVNYIGEVFSENPAEEFLLGSVRATEHSVMCLSTEVYGELETFRRILTDNPTGIVSVVSDAFDYFNVLTSYLPQLKELIESRDGKLVIRPDTGNPVDVIVGTKSDMTISGRTPEEKGSIELLWDTFGGTVNEQGYKVLSAKVGLIYGDSITFERSEAISQALLEKGFASTNVVFGVGSYEAHFSISRDTFNSAVKATAGVVDGKDYLIFKDPKTGDGMKKSARGYLKVTVNDEGNFTLTDKLSRDEFEASIEDGTNELRPVDPHSVVSFKDIQARVRSII